MNTPSLSNRCATWILAGLLFLVPLVHSDSISKPFSLPKESVLLFGALLLLLVGILSFLFEATASRLQSPAFIAAAALAVAGALAIAPSVNRPLALNGLVDLAAGLALFWGVTRFVRTPSSCATLFRAVSLAALLVSLGTIVQVMIPGYNLSLSGWSLLPPSNAGSTLGDSGLAAQFLLLAVPITIGTAAMSTGVQRTLWGGCLGLVASALYFAGRPEGWIVAGCTLALLVATRVMRAARLDRRWGDLAPDLAGHSLRAFLVCVIVVVAVISISRMPGLSPSGGPAAPLEGVTLLSPRTDDPAGDRAATATGSLALIAKHPLGVGLGNWRHAFLEVAWSQVIESPFTLSHQPHHAGNSFLELTAEAGILGGVIFLGLVVLLLLQAGFSASAEPESWGTVGYVSLNALATLCLISLLGSPMQEPTPALLFWVIAGLTQVSLQSSASLPGWLKLTKPRERSLAPLPVRRRSFGWVAALVWVVAVAWSVTWSRDRFQVSRSTLLGQAAHYAGQYTGAIRALDSPLVRRSPDHIPHALAGNAYARLGLNELAVARFTQVIARSPHFPAAYLGRAAAYQAMGRYDLADDDLHAALRIWPDGTDLLLALGRLNHRRGRLEAALENYEQIAELEDPPAEAFFRMGIIHDHMGRMEEAIKAFLQCGRKDPSYPGLRLHLGMAYHKEGRFTMALQQLQLAVSADPKSIEARLQLADTYNTMGRPCDARDALEAARDLEVDAARRSRILDLIDRVDSRCLARQKRAGAR